MSDRRNREKARRGRIEEKRRKKRWEGAQMGDNEEKKKEKTIHRSSQRQPGSREVREERQRETETMRKREEKSGCFAWGKSAHRPPFPLPSLPFATVHFRKLPTFG